MVEVSQGRRGTCGVPRWHGKMAGGRIDLGGTAVSLSVPRLSPASANLGDQGASTVPRVHRPPAQNKLALKSLPCLVTSTPMRPFDLGQVIQYLCSAATTRTTCMYLGGGVRGGVPVLLQIWGSKASEQMNTIDGQITRRTSSMRGKTMRRGVRGDLCASHANPMYPL